MVVTLYWAVAVLLDLLSVDSDNTAFMVRDFWADELTWVVLDIDYI